MKRLVFADTHLTSKHYPRLERFLLDLVLGYDEVIINGDLWDEDLTDFAAMQSSWGDLLEVLAAKRTVYLPGNHDDDIDLADQAWFAAEVVPVYRFTDNGRSFHVEHGHKYDTPSKVRSSVPQPFLSLIAHLNNMRTGILSKLMPYYSIDGAGFSKQQSIIRDQIDADVVIFSHSHIPLASKDLYNTGSIMHGLASYLHIEDGTVQLIKTNY